IRRPYFADFKQREFILFGVRRQREPESPPGIHRL
ncbi:uncharacterized protein METZ01_LOCUS402755, partial [marine metagenome]